MTKMDILLTDSTHTMLFLSYGEAQEVCKQVIASILMTLIELKVNDLTVQSEIRKYLSDINNIFTDMLDALPEDLDKISVPIKIRQFEIRRYVKHRVNRTVFTERYPIRQLKQLPPVRLMKILKDTLVGAQVCLYKGLGSDQDRDIVTISYEKVKTIYESLAKIFPPPEEDHYFHAISVAIEFIDFDD